MIKHVRMAPMVKVVNETPTTKNVRVVPDKIYDSNLHIKHKKRS